MYTRCRYRDEFGKSCTKCDEYRLFSEYYGNRNVKRDGLASECKRCSNKHTAAYSKKTGAIARSRKNKAASLRTYTDRIFYTYRVSKEEATRLSQVPACDCCGAVLGDGGRSRNVDHSYVTGRVRGVLCAQCNTGIGKLGDSASGVERAAAYLVGSVDALSMATNGDTYLPDYI